MTPPIGAVRPEKRITGWAWQTLGALHAEAIASEKATLRVPIWSVGIKAPDGLGHLSEFARANDPDVVQFAAMGVDCCETIKVTDR